MAYYRWASDEMEAHNGLKIHSVTNRVWVRVPPSLPS